MQTTRAPRGPMVVVDLADVVAARVADGTANEEEMLVALRAAERVSRRAAVSIATITNR